MPKGSRDKSRDKWGVKAKRKRARDNKNARRDFQAGQNTKKHQFESWQKKSARINRAGIFLFNFRGWLAADSGPK